MLFVILNALISCTLLEVSSMSDISVYVIPPLLAFINPQYFQNTNIIWGKLFYVGALFSHRKKKEKEACGL